MVFTKLLWAPFSLDEGLVARAVDDVLLPLLPKGV